MGAKGTGVMETLREIGGAQIVERGTRVRFRCPCGRCEVSMTAKSAMRAHQEGRKIRCALCRSASTNQKSPKERFLKKLGGGDYRERSQEVGKL